MFWCFQKGTKNALETGRTFATLFADMELRQKLLAVHSEDDFKKLLWEHTKELAEEQSHPDRKTSGDKVESEEDIKVGPPSNSFHFFLPLMIYHSP